MHHFVSFSEGVRRKVHPRVIHTSKRMHTAKDCLYKCLSKFRKYPVPGTGTEALLAVRPYRYIGAMIIVLHHANVFHTNYSEHAHDLQTADTSIDGSVLITIHPTAIALHTTQPSGSPRNTWQTTVATVEPLGDTTRITLADPLPLGVDITPASTQALGLQNGTPIWASVKATEISITPAG